jgi:hypothetical protein
MVASPHMAQVANGMPMIAKRRQCEISMEIVDRGLTLYLCQAHELFELAISCCEIIQVPCAA